LLSIFLYCLLTDIQLSGTISYTLVIFRKGDPSVPLQSAAELIALAAKAGVRRVTILCGPEESDVEKAVKASDLEWTILQPVEFMANAIVDWGESIRSENLVREPFPNALSAKIHEADIAAVAVAALLQEGHAGKAYTLTGPDAIARAESVRIISEGTGRDIRLIEQSEQEAREQWRMMGYPDEAIDFFVEMGQNTPEVGYTVLPTVEEVTGRKARNFADWVLEHAEHFAKA
jgi:uncharacterized protein YbjT (DUF2867 family)